MLSGISAFVTGSTTLSDFGDPKTIGAIRRNVSQHQEAL